MRKPAMTRLAGTLAAIPMCAILSGAVTSPAYAQTTSPSPVLNNQLNLGEIFSEQTLNVQTVSDGVTASTVAQGTGISGGVTNADVAVTSNQENQGAIYAHTIVDVGANAGAASAVRSTAAGNSASLSASNGTISAFAVQVNSGEVTARGQVEAAEAEAKDLTVSTLAMGNTAGVNLDNGSAGLRISQNNSANTLADGGAIVQYVSGTSAITATTTGNNINIQGGNQSAARAITDQANTSEVTQASKFTAYGNSYLTATTATATGNNLSATNEGPLMDVTSNQWNTSYVRGQAEGTSYQFGAAQTQAYAAGNSSQVNNVGTELVLDNLQTNNGGGVEATASFEGHDGYDAVTTATAMGNAVTGYVCAKCSGRMTVTNNQTNSADIGAKSSTTITSSGRQVTGVSTAIGNNASFNISAPN
ncbi:holdfast anchor protein HfaD [Caulobacter segnis]